MPERGPGDEERAFAAELDQVEGRHRAAGCAKESQHAARAQAVEAPLKGGLAHRVVDHVDALAAGEALDLGFEVLLGVEDHVGGAGLARELGLGWGGDGSDDARADACSHLREQQAHAAGSGVHQRRVAGFQRKGGVGKIVRGHALQHGGGGLLGREAGGDLDQLRRGNQRVLGIAAQHGDRSDGIALGLKPVTPGPSSSTVPAASLPGMRGSEAL